MPIRASWQPRPATDVYIERILGMMRDYKISLAQAIIWDFEGFPPLFTNHILLTAEDELRYYFHVNHLPEADHQFFIDILMGKEPDYGIAKDKQKDAGSPEGT